MSGLADLQRGTTGYIRLPSYNTPSAPTVPDSSPVQSTLPTSAFGQTIPVIYGKARIPGGYIWTSPIVTVTETHMEGPLLVNQHSVTTTTTKMSCRLRFARPLVPDSTWALRRIWAEGKLLYNAATGYRASGLRFRFYDGRSTQGRDPTMTAEEGTNNVSAHRGYIDLVLTDIEIQGFGAPPTFEVEVIQDGATNHDYDNFTTITSGVANSIVPVWQDGMAFVNTEAGGLVRSFSIGAIQEYFYVEHLDFSNLFEGWRYSRNLDRLMYLGQDGGGDWSFYLNDPVSGIVDVGDTVGTVAAVIGTVCLVEFPNTAVYVGFTDDQEFFAYYVEQNTASLAYESVTSWDGYTNFECITPGEVRGSDFDVYLCADADLVKVTFSSTGTLKAFSVAATLSDDLRYAVYDGGAVVVWTDAATVVRLNGTTGAIEFTKSVPYQIETYSSRKLGDPDLQRLSNELYFVASSTSYFTDLSTGETRSVSGATNSPQTFYYDGQNDIVLTKSALGILQRLRVVAGDGTQRALSDFLTDLMVHGGGFETSDISVEGVDDVIDGAVVDITAGTRDIARATCEPYSIAIFERSGRIIFKRASTDTGFAVDQTVASAGDIIDLQPAIKARRYNPEEFIARYGINYRDPDAIYQARAQFGEIPSLPLPVAPADQSVKANIPIIVGADTIKTLATQKVNRLALERHEFQMTLRAKYADTEPEDIIQFPFSNRTITARVTESTQRPDYMTDIVCTEFLSSVSIVISGDAGRPVEPDPAGTTDSRYYHLDIPLLSDADDLAGAGLVQYHVLASAGQPYWDGATLYKRDDTGVYQPAAIQTENGIIGVALTALPDWDLPYVTEFTRSITIGILSGDTSQLSSATYLEMMNGANVFAIGQPGRWEVCQVMTITNNGNGTLTFEGLRRGRMSSEEYTATHQAGDFMVWLSEDNVQNIDYAIASLNGEFSFKAVGFGDSLNTTLAVNRTVTGEAEKIPKPCQLDASIDSPSDIRLSWVRRSRIGSYWADDGGYEAPLGESLEQYVIRIKSGPSGTVLRTVTVDDATHYDYSGGNQIADFGSLRTSGMQLTFDIRQVSGTGVTCPTREATIDL